MDWILYGRDLFYERVKKCSLFLISFIYALNVKFHEDKNYKTLKKEV